MVPLRSTRVRSCLLGGPAWGIPIVLATIPLTAGHPDGSLVFDVVLVTVFASLILHAGTVGALLSRLGFTEKRVGAIAPGTEPETQAACAPGTP